MAGVTGPIMTLPGALYAVPEGMMCDDHPDRPATHRLQGETDSFGSEMHDLCDECAKSFEVYKADTCDWCEEPADDCRPTRDYDEGLYGPVYHVCGKCRKRANEEAAEELRYYDDCWDDYDDDTYEAERAEIYDDEPPPLPARKVIVKCHGCRKPWEPKHQCRLKIAKTNRQRKEMLNRG